jgi:hypothetical protein
MFMDPKHPRRENQRTGLPRRRSTKIRPSLTEDARKKLDRSQNHETKPPPAPSPP